MSASPALRNCKEWPTSAFQIDIKARKMTRINYYLLKRVSLACESKWGQMRKERTHSTLCDDMCHSAELTHSHTRRTETNFIARCGLTFMEFWLRHTPALRTHTHAFNSMWEEKGAEKQQRKTKQNRKRRQLELWCHCICTAWSHAYACPQLQCTTRDEQLAYSIREWVGDAHFHYGQPCPLHGSWQSRQRVYLVQLDRSN